MNRLGWRVQFVILAVAWGSAFWWIALRRNVSWIGVKDCRPHAIAAAAMMLVVRMSGIRLPRGRVVWSRAVVVGCTINVVPGALTAVMQQYVTSSVAAILIAAIPLGVVAGTLIGFRDQRPNRITVLGLLTGLVGILVFLGVWHEPPVGQWWAVLGLVGVVISCGVGFPFYGHHFGRSTIHPTAIVAMQLTMAAVVLLVLSVGEAAARGLPDRGLTWQAVAGVLGLGLVSGALGNTLSFRVLRAAGPTVMSMVNYVVPVVAVVIGVLFLGDRLSWNQLVGGAVVLVGVAIAQGLVRSVAGARAPT